jgi:transcription antitermination factor NusG
MAEEIARIQSLEAAGARPHTQPLTPGATVIVRRGPLAGCQGSLLREKSHDRVVVMVNFLRRAVVAEIGSSDVEPLAA